MNSFLQISSIIVGVGAVAWAFHLIWKFFIQPIYKATLALAAFMEAQPTLLEIAHEFKKNDGNTLRDQVDLLNVRMGNLEGSIEKLVTNWKAVQRWDGDERRGP